MSLIKTFKNYLILKNKIYKIDTGIKFNYVLSINGNTDDYK